MSAIWRVLGGGDKGGIVVRNGSSLSSTQDILRLETGALVQEAGWAAFFFSTLVGWGYAPVECQWLYKKTAGWLVVTSLVGCLFVEGLFGRLSSVRWNLEVWNHPLLEGSSQDGRKWLLHLVTCTYKLKREPFGRRTLPHFGDEN